MTEKDPVLDGWRRLIEEAEKRPEYYAQGSMRFFVSNLLRAMDRRGMSNADLAAAIGSSPAYVTKILRGDINFTLVTMTKLAMAVDGKLDVRILGKAEAVRTTKRASSR